MSTTMSSDRRFVAGRVSDPWSLVTTDDDPFAGTTLADPAPAAEQPELPDPEPESRQTLPTPEKAQKTLATLFNRAVITAVSGGTPASDYDRGAREVTAEIAGIVLTGRLLHESPVTTWQRALEHVTVEVDQPELVTPVLDGRRAQAITLRNALWGAA